jgi:hypothetical protein
MKDATVRINGVLAFILNCGLLTANERASAHHLATNFINTKHPPANAGQQAYNDFSNAMSFGSHIGLDPNDIRNRKRASYLLYHAILDAEPASTLVFNAQIPDGHARVTLQDYLRKAANQWEIGHGGINAAQAAFNFLLNHPLQFLQTNKLIVHGSTARAVGMGDRNVLPFYFGYQSPRDRYRFCDQAVPGFCQVNVDSVKAEWWHDVPGRWIVGNLAGGDFSQIEATELHSPLMITTQFTGCTFCMKAHGAHTYCAHVTPKSDNGTGNAPRVPAPPLSLDGHALSLEVVNRNGANGDFGNAPGGNQLSLYGPGFSRNVRVGAGGYPNHLGGGDYMTIVGVQRAPGYEIYSQINQNNLITSAQQVF